MTDVIFFIIKSGISYYLRTSGKITNKIAI
jgi:hypothetical protein